MSIQNAFSQSIYELLNIAAAENLELQSLEKEYLAALEVAPQVNQLPDPEFGAGVFPLPVETRLGAQLIRISGTQMLPWPGLLDGMSELEMSKAKAKYERIAARQIDVFFEIKKSWFNLYEINKTQVIIKRNIKLLSSLEQLALAKVESGKASAADVLQIQLKITELKQRINILEVAKANPFTSINQLLNRDLNNEIIIQDSLEFAQMAFDKNAFKENITANHPFLKMLLAQQETARRAIALNELNSKPMFGVGLDYIMVNERSDAAPAHNGRDIVMLRGSVKVPLNKGRFAAKEREERLKIEAVELQKEDALVKFNKIIEQAYADHEQSRLNLELYEQQIKLMQAAIRILESEYSATGKRFDELLQLEKELIDFELKKLREVVKSHLAKASVERFVFN